MCTLCISLSRGSIIVIICSMGSVTYKRATDLVSVPVGQPLSFYRSPERVSDLHKPRVAPVSRRVRSRVWGSGLLGSWPAVLLQLNNLEEAAFLTQHRERESANSLMPLLRATAIPSRLHVNLITSPRPRLQTPSRWC